MLAARESWVGPSFLSTIRQETPCRFSSAAMNRPTGPAPTTNTWVSVAISSCQLCRSNAIETIVNELSKLFVLQCYPVHPHCRNASYRVDTPAGSVDWATPATMYLRPHDLTRGGEA